MARSLRPAHSTAWRRFHASSSWVPPSADSNNDPWITPSFDVGWSEKRYPRFERFRLSVDDAMVDEGASSLALRSSTRSYKSDTKLPFSQLVHVVRSVLSHVRLDTSSMPYASAGAIYGVEAYVLCSRVQGIAAGLYHILKADHALEWLWPVPEAELAETFVAQPWVMDAHVLMILTANVAAYELRYGERGYRFALMEAGEVVQEIVRAANTQSLGSCVVGGFVDDGLARVLDLRAVDPEVPMCAATVGLEGRVQEVRDPG
jgi:SagB-type dehydrogenase family enzyme